MNEMVAPYALDGALALLFVITGDGAGFTKFGSVLRSTLNPLSLAELSVQESVTLLEASRTAEKFEGGGGATWKIIGRIMSFSSWPRMWQCHTYSWPKFTLA